MSGTTLKELFKDGSTTLSCALTGAASPAVAQAFADAGYDFIMVDLEHGSNVPEIVDPVLAAIETSGAFTAVKARSQSEEDIRDAYNFAPGAIYVPGINSAEETARAAEIFARVAGEGAPRRKAMDVAFVALVESMDGINDGENIANVPDVDAMAVGLFDLSRDLGMPGDVTNPKMIAAFEKLLEAARATGVCTGVGGPGISKEQWDAWRPMGNRLELAMIDMQAVRAAAAQGMEIVQSSGRRA